MKIIAVGMNYAAHVAEMNNKLAPEPVFFMKPESALVLNNKPIFYPNFTQQLEFECEIVVKISKLGKAIQEKFAHRYYEELTLGIDFTARDLQLKCKQNGQPWEIAKAFDQSAPIGRWLNKNELPPVDNLNFFMTQNGEIRQRASSAEMLLSIDKLISKISQFCTLKTGDLIFTGTPAGVGAVQIGDVLEAFLEDKLLLRVPIK